MALQKVFVTGANGFIGSRFCERLKLRYELPYRAFVRNLAKAHRIARLDAELCQGDLLDLESIRRALRGCDAVVHLAYSSAVEPKGTRNLLQACREAKIERFVHVSSVAVHGPAPGPESAVEETATISRYGEGYSDVKARVENLVRRGVQREGLPAVILRPTLVYGPYGAFVLDIIQSSLLGLVTLIDDGKWICNAVYVDDVCDAIAAALESQEAIGKACFVTADQSVSWREFIVGFAQMVDPPPAIRSISSEELRRYWVCPSTFSIRANLSAIARLLVSQQFHQQLSTVPAFDACIRVTKRLVRHLISREQLLRLKARTWDSNDGACSTPAGWNNPGRLIRETCPITFSNRMAKRLLKWQPRFDFFAGAELTKTWLSFAGLLTAKHDSVTFDAELKSGQRREYSLRKRSDLDKAPRAV
ncbi:MAG: NAD-dependent epimerase/dehydratase family protein [Deltaproteobacteria bacterium]|nr:NAD-dependent epimerase/dehydratase family protein [Deltaproteobacteria bacterium]